MPFLRAAARLTALAMATACAADGGAWAGTEETLPNGARRVLNPAEGVWAEGHGWTLEEDLRIGAIEGDETLAFGRIAALEVDPLERVWLIEGQAQELRVFDANGAHVRTIGRQGSGPGEFRNAGALAWDASGRLWVGDAMNARYTSYDTAGSLLETLPRESRAPPFVGYVAVSDAGWLYDYDLVPSDDGAVAPPLMAAAGVGSAGRSILRAMHDVSSAGERAQEPAESANHADTVDIPSAERAVPSFVHRTERTMMSVGVPFSPRMHWTFDRRGYVWFGESDRYQVTQRRFSGDTVLVIERAYTRLPVTSDEVSEWERRPGPIRFRERGGRIDASRIPSEKPVFEQLLVDDEGHLWVRLIGSDSVPVFNVFRADGRYLGAVRGIDRLSALPAPVFRRGRMYAVVRDSFDVAYVARFRVMRRD